MKFIELFTDPNAQMVLIGTILLSMGAALVGCFTFLRKRALVGDAVAHSVLPGICVAFILSGNKNPWVLMLGAVVAGWISLLFMDLIVTKSKIKTDAATGIILSVFFGLGIFLLTAIQKSGNAEQTGLDKFLFGKAASMLQQDVITFGTTASILIVLIVVFYKAFKLVSFNPEFARSIGLPVWFYEFLLSTMTVFAVASGIQAVGVVLMAALLITPATAARYWTEKLPVMLTLAAVFALISALIGTYISFIAPHMPTGPWIIVIISIIALLSIFVAPGKGMISKWSMQRSNSIKILRENILKSFYHLGEGSTSFEIPRSESELKKTRGFKPQELMRGLKMLRSDRLVVGNNGQWSLSADGFEESKRIVRLHRLWEMYLNKKLNLEPDHVHHDAEAMEHVITPELEELLVKELGNPSSDPHNSNIPGS